ncbi:MAG: hypothetical protein HQL90_09785 [Magnetococcales bacterium]|nr:hypothetical protein [Magnetococcales bacterium]
MAALLDGIIKQEDLDVAPQRVPFELLVGEEHRRRGEEFVRFLPGGRLPEQPKPNKDPEISPEELHRRRLEVIERETYQKAFAAGEEAGLALGEQTMEREIARLLPQFESVLRQLDNLPKRIFASAERLLVETAIMMARQLLGHELSIDPTEVSHRVQRGLEQMAERRDVVIYLAPDTAALLQNMVAFEKLRIEADPTVEPGSVRLESDFGGIEDNLDQQLAEMEAGLRRYLQDRLQVGGCEDIAAAASRTAEQAALHKPAIASLIQPLPSRSPVPPASLSSQPAVNHVPVNLDAPSLGVGEIASALAEAQDPELAWPEEDRAEDGVFSSREGEEVLPDGGDESVPDEEDYSMEETVVSVATSRFGNNARWGATGFGVSAEESGDPAASEPVSGDDEES